MTVVEAVGRRGIVLAGVALPGLVAALALGAGAVLVVAGQTALAVPTVIVGAGLALVLRRLFARQPLAWHLAPEGASAVHPGRPPVLVPWDAVAEVAVLDQVRPGATQSHRVRVVELRDRGAGALLRIGHTTADAQHDREVLNHLADRARALTRAS